MEICHQFGIFHEEGGNFSEVFSEISVPARLTNENLAMLHVSYVSELSLFAIFS